MNDSDILSVLIVGTGFSGLCLGMKLKEQGRDDFLLLEKAASLGGTWRENTYPGAECDVASALYSYSFSHNPDWDYRWSEQPQILAYLKGNAEQSGVAAHMRFNQEVARLDWDADAALWHVETRDGTRYRARTAVSAVGQLHHPHIPDYEGHDGFAGPQFHSARWDHAVALAGKRVAVIGNAASALQFIPQIAPEVAHLSVYQRSANWVMPKNDQPYSARQQARRRRFPFLAKIDRFKVWLRGEAILWPMMRGKKWAQKLGEKAHRQYLEETIADPELRAKLTPDYPIGAKRILFTDDYFEALARPNVDVVTTRVARITPAGIVREDGAEEAVDAIIYGTGFRSNPFLHPMQVTGREGQTLRAAWADGAQAYLGLTVSGFPNFFMMYGPNTNLGHNSIIVMIEAQTRYILDALARLERGDARAVDLKPEALARYNETLQARLKEMVWSAVGASWYLDHGRSTNNWAGRTTEYIRRTKCVDWDDYALIA